jgi:hypothetical protein
MTQATERRESPDDAAIRDPGRNADGSDLVAVRAVNDYVTAWSDVVARAGVAGISDTQGMESDERRAG